jgi:hypothetical protein
MRGVFGCVMCDGVHVTRLDHSARQDADDDDQHDALNDGLEDLDRDDDDDADDADDVDGDAGGDEDNNADPSSERATHGERDDVTKQDVRDTDEFELPDNLDIADDEGGDDDGDDHDHDDDDANVRGVHLWLCGWM